MASEMDDRKKRILKVITDDYIISAEPVGSRAIARRYDLGISPATIRNEMADLEDSGFLEQPHTSAGRVPSGRGYRYYVDALMSLRTLSENDIKRIQMELEHRNRQLEEIIHQTSKLLVQLTEYPSLVMAPQMKTSVFRHVQLVKMSDKAVLVLVVSDTGHVTNKVIELDNNIDDEELDRISTMLNQKLRGISFDNLNSAILNDIRNEMANRREFFEEAMKLIAKTVSAATSQEKVFVNGTTKILEQPEFVELDKVKPLLDALDEEEQLQQLLMHGNTSGMHVHIGEENQSAALADCSVITTGYEIAGRTVGVIGVLGPTRMDYAKVMPLVEHTANVLSELLTQLCKHGKR